VRAAALDVALAAGALPIVMGDDPDAVTRESLPSGLRGAYQHDNARIATRVARELGIGDAARREGLRRTSWPGRFEHVEVGSGPYRGAWLLDGAHNPDGARALVHGLADEATRGAAPPGAMVFGALADKQWLEMLDVLAEIACPRVYVAPKGRAAAPPAALAAHVAGHLGGSIAEGLRVARAAAGSPASPVVVCGSLYLVGEARAQLLELEMDPPVAL